MPDSTPYLTKVRLQAELGRCLECRTQPCSKACPVNCNPHEFIKAAREVRWDDAVSAIMRTNPMGQTCGLICPDKFCMKACTRCHVDFPINIPRVQATILNAHRAEPAGLQYAGIVRTGRRIAVVGAGPAGLAAASRLAKSGADVDIFERSSRAGGALNLIPEARLPNSVISKDLSHIVDGDRVKIHFDTDVRDPRSLLDLFDGVIVATGEPNCMRLGIPGEDLSLGYPDYLGDPEGFAATGNVAVIGGGNVAADCAMTAIRMGAASVEMFVRRRISDMRVSRAELMELINAGVQINAMTSPVSIEPAADGHKILAVRRNVRVDGRWTALEGSVVKLPYFDMVVRAIGSRADEKIEGEPRIVYAGDCKTGGSTIVEALASGSQAAEAFI